MLSRCPTCEKWTPINDQRTEGLCNVHTAIKLYEQERVLLCDRTDKGDHQLQTQDYFGCTSHSDYDE